MHRLVPQPNRAACAGLPANEDLGLKPAYSVLASETISMRTGAFLQMLSKTPPGAAGKSLTAIALAAAGLLLAGTADRAEAQLFPWGGWQGPSPWQAQPRRQRRIQQYVEPKDENPTSTLPKPEGPLLLVVSLGNQTVTVYDGTTKLATSPISSGMRGRETPTGIFSILEKNRYHYSNLYGGAPMPFMNRITNSGVALHAGQLPGYAASHGCIRLPYSFARNLFGITADRRPRDRQPRRPDARRVPERASHPAAAARQRRAVQDRVLRRHGCHAGIRRGCTQRAYPRHGCGRKSGEEGRARRRDHGGGEREDVGGGVRQVDGRPRTQGQGRHPQGPPRGGPNSPTPPARPHATPRMARIASPI